MKKGHQKIKRATKPDSIRLAKILLHKAIVTKKLAAVEYEQQIHAIAEGKETFSLDTYKELKRELTTLRNLVKEVHSDLGNEGLRKLKEETRIKYLTIFDYHNNRTTRKVLDRFRKREEKVEVIIDPNIKVPTDRKTFEKAKRRLKDMGEINKSKSA